MLANKEETSIDNPTQASKEECSTANISITKIKTLSPCLTTIRTNGCSHMPILKKTH